MGRPPESNLEIIFADWLDAMRRGDIQTMAKRLDPEAVHQGVKPEWICRNREEVLENVRSRVGNTPAVEAIELIAAGDNVLMTVKAPDVGLPVDGAKTSSVAKHAWCSRCGTGRSSGSTITCSALTRSTLRAHRYLGTSHWRKLICTRARRRGAPVGSAVASRHRQCRENLRLRWPRPPTTGSSRRSARPPPVSALDRSYAADRGSIVPVAATP